jgi:O-antigen ligase
MQQHLNSVPSRLETYREAIILIKEKFLFGHSANKFSIDLLSSDINATIDNPFVKVGNAESDFFQMFIEHGFVGFMIKISLFIYLLILNIKNKDHFNISFILMIIVFSIFVTLSFYFFYWISIAMIISRTFVKINK